MGVSVVGATVGGVIAGPLGAYIGVKAGAIAGAGMSAAGWHFFSPTKEGKPDS